MDNDLQALSAFWISGRKLFVISCSSNKPNEKDENHKFAYYVYEKNVRTQTRWYSGIPFAEFSIDDDAIQNVRVEAFVRSSNGEKLRTHSTPVFIYGTVAKDQYLIGISKSLNLLGCELELFSSEGQLNLTSTTDGSKLLEILQSTKKNHSKYEALDFYSADMNDSPISGLSLNIRHAYGISSIGWTDPRIALDVLTTDSVEKFLERFTYASKRHLDPAVAKLVALNNINTPGTPLNIYINSLVVYTYKSLEKSKCNDDYGELVAKIDFALARIDELPMGNGVRSDPIQLALSLSTAKIHILLSLGLFHKIIAEAMRCIQTLDRSEFKGYYSVNLAKILAIAAFSAHKANMPSLADSLLGKLIVTSRLAQNWIDCAKPGWLFSEIKYVLSLSEAGARIHSGERSFADYEFTTEFLKEASRVKTSHYLDQLDALCQRLPF